MTTLGFDKPLYILPFDHRGSFQKKMFGWDGALSAQQTAEIAAAKRVIYDALVAAIDAGVPRDKAGTWSMSSSAPRFSAMQLKMDTQPVVRRRRAVRRN